MMKRVQDIKLKCGCIPGYSWCTIKSKLANELKQARNEYNSTGDSIAYAIYRQVHNRFMRHG